MPTVMDYTQGAQRVGVYFRHESEVTLLVGLHSNYVGIQEQVDPDDFARNSDVEFIERVAGELLSRLPNLDLRLQEGYAGIYPYSPDWLPIVGPFQADSSVIACTGGGGVGVNLSPIMGRIAAEWALFAAPKALTAATRLLPGRFAQRETSYV